MSDSAWAGRWAHRFINWLAQDQATVPKFGEPFLDAQSLMRSTIGAESLMITDIGRTAVMSDAIEVSSRFASSRISRSVK